MLFEFRNSVGHTIRAEGASETEAETAMKAAVADLDVVHDHVVVGRVVGALPDGSGGFLTDTALAGLKEAFAEVAKP